MSKQNIVKEQLRFMTISEAAQYLSLGKTRTRDFVEKIGAMHRIGKRILVDKNVVDSYFDENRRKEDSSYDN